jgi:hypothetical protein
MDVRIDSSRQDVVAGSVDDLATIQAEADSRDLLATDADIGQFLAILIDDCTALDDQVERRVAHGNSS